MLNYKKLITLCMISLLASCYSNTAVKQTKNNVEISWMAEISIKSDRVNDFKKLINKMCTDVNQNQQYALNYEWYEGKDNVFYIYERYSNSETTKQHLMWFGKNYAKDMVPMFDVKKMPITFIVHGDPDKSTRKLLQEVIKSQVVFTKRVVGFSR